MPTVRKLRRPDFESSLNRSVWLSQDGLPPSLRAELSKLLPKRMTGDQQDQFLYFVGQTLGMVEAWSDLTSPAAAQARIQKVEELARALQRAIADLNPAAVRGLETQAQASMRGDDVPHLYLELGKLLSGADESFISAWWDVAQGIELAAAHASTDIEPSKLRRPKIDIARSLVHAIAGNYMAATGRLPPHSKGTWFCSFMSEAAKPLGVKIGHELVEAVVNAMKAA